MKRTYPQIRLAVSIVVLLLTGTVVAQTITTLEESDLPILYFESLNGEVIVIGFKRQCRMLVYDNGGTNRLTDAPVDSVEGGYAFLNIRGASSLAFPKRNINVEFNVERGGADIEKALLGMPQHEEWALHGPYSDKTLIRNALAYSWGRSIQPWAPRSRFVNVVVSYDINNVRTEVYEGIYLLTEEPHRDNDRVDIAKLDQSDLSGSELTGGYILEIGEESSAPLNSFWMSAYAQDSDGTALTQYNISYPNTDSLDAIQFSYIKEYVDGIENRMANRATANDPQTGYRNFINLPSWIDHNIIQELTGNYDAYRRSAFILKDRDDNGGRFAAGPVWDFNIAFGNDFMCMGQNTTGWVTESNATCGKTLPKFIDWMFEDPMYRARFRARWEGLRQNLLSNARLNSDIDSLLAIIIPDQPQDQDRWQQIGTFVWPNDFIGDTYQEEVDYLRNWVLQRAAWIDANVRSWPTVESLQNRNHTLPVMRVEVLSGDTVGTGRTDATLRVVNNGPDQLNSPDGSATGYTGKLAIELRGAADEKSAYAFELRDASDEDYAYRLLDMPKEEDWELVGPYSDKTMLRNALAYDIAGDLMEYAPRTEPVVLYINGDYKGIYVLTESVKRDNNRIDIANLNDDENTGDDLTGGYILELDEPSSNPDRGFLSDLDASAFYRYHTPDDGDITPQQKTYIEGVLDNFEQAIQAGGFAASRNLMDIESFVDFMLVQELGANSKAYGTNTFLYKNKDSNNPLLHVGPVWDFNRGFGNDNRCGGTTVQDWVVEDNGRCGNATGSVPFWWQDLWSDPAFRAIVTSRWRSLRQNQLTNANLGARVDALARPLIPEVDQNFSLYPILGQQVGRNAFVGSTYAEEVAYLRQWLIDRAIWMDGAIDQLTNTSALPSGIALSLSPNPSLGSPMLTVNYDLGTLSNAGPTVEVKLIDQLGRTLQSTTVQSTVGNVVMVTEQLPTGFYYVQLVQEDRAIAIEKWVR